MKALLQNLVTGVLVACAVLVTVVIVKREFFDQAPASASAPATRLDDWQRLVDQRPPVLGARSAKLQVIEFSDYQCPFCRDLETKLAGLSAAHPDRFSVLRYELPLVQIHANAMPAAVASKCASRQGNYQAFHAALVARSAALEKVDYPELARQVRVPNVDAFVACLGDAEAQAAVKADMAVADSLGFKGTPMLVVNGDVLSGTQDMANLRKLLLAD